MTTKSMTIAATLLCLGGVASYYKGNEAIKPLALNITICAASVAATNYLSSKWTEMLNKEQFATIETRLKNQVENLEKTNQQCLIALFKAKQLCVRTTKELAEKTAILQAYEQQSGVIKREFHSKTEELNAKIQEDDTRSADCLNQFKVALIQYLRVRIDKVYNELNRSIEHKLTTQDENGMFEYQNIMIPLQRFRTVLETKYVNHCNILDEINDFQHTEVLIGALILHSQIGDEIAALKVRYRNVLNVDERRQLEDAYTKLADCVPKKQADFSR